MPSVRHHAEEDNHYGNPACELLVAPPFPLVQSATVSHLTLIVSHGLENHPFLLAE